MTKTRAPVPKPPTQRLMATAPLPGFTPSNLSRPSDGVVDLNFKTSPDFRHEFRMAATSWGMSQKELLEAAFKTWVEKFGAAPTKR